MPGQGSRQRDKIGQLSRESGVPLTGCPCVYARVSDELVVLTSNHANPCASRLAGRWCTHHPLTR